MIRLSICIPTYNFGRFIEQTLDSILPYINSEVEVVVLDGGSKDNTENIIFDKQVDYPQLRYCPKKFRGGIDRDIEEVVSLAQGDYCWLFSADDIMLPGSVGIVLETIKSNVDVYLCEHVLCDLDMKKIRDYPAFYNITLPRLFDLGSIIDKNKYFCSARTSEAFFSFMAGPIFKKKSWDSIQVPESFYGTCWIVAGHLLSLVPSGLTVSCIGEVLLHKRGENDSFADKGVVNRHRIAIEGFQHVADTVFGYRSEEAFNIRRVLKNEITLPILLMAKLKSSKYPEVEDADLLYSLVKKHYADRSFIDVVSYTIYKYMPVLVIQILSLVRNRLLK